MNPFRKRKSPKLLVRLLRPLARFLVSRSIVSFKPVDPTGLIIIVSDAKVPSFAVSIAAEAAVAFAGSEIVFYDYDRLIQEGKLKVDGDDALGDLVAILAQERNPSRVILITSRWVYTENHELVHGYASTIVPVSLVSTFSLKKKWVENLIKVVVHELAHTMGVPHCLNENCLMNAVDREGKLDGLHVKMCSSCESQVRDNTRVPLKLV